jgi:hypothetical protein
MVAIMSNYLGPVLENLFAEAERPLEEHAFMSELLAELQRVQRGRTRRRIAVAVAAVLAAFGVMPTVLEQTASFVHLVISWMESAPPTVYWVMSSFIGIWVIVRTGRLGRR